MTVACVLKAALLAWVLLRQGTFEIRRAVDDESQMNCRRSALVIDDKFLNKSTRARASRRKSAATMTPSTPRNV